MHMAVSADLQTASFIHLGKKGLSIKNKNESVCRLASTEQNMSPSFSFTFTILHAITHPLFTFFLFIFNINLLLLLDDFSVMCMPISEISSQKSTSSITTLTHYGPCDGINFIRQLNFNN